MELATGQSKSLQKVQNLLEALYPHLLETPLHASITPFEKESFIRIDEAKVSEMVALSMQKMRM